MSDELLIVISTSIQLPCHVPPKTHSLFSMVAPLTPKPMCISDDGTLRGIGGVDVNMRPTNGSIDSRPGSTRCWTLAVNNNGNIAAIKFKTLVDAFACTCSINPAHHLGTKLLCTSVTISIESWFDLLVSVNSSKE